MADMLKVRRPTGDPNLAIALGWHVLTTHGKEIVWHNGGTGGYRTFIGFDPTARVGIVVLSNSGTTAGPDDIGRHLLDTSLPLLPAQTPPKDAHRNIRGSAGDGEATSDAISWRRPRSSPCRATAAACSRS